MLGDVPVCLIHIVFIIPCLQLLVFRLIKGQHGLLVEATFTKNGGLGLIPSACRGKMVVITCYQTYRLLE